jgi:hypothetical protein
MKYELNDDGRYTTPEALRELALFSPGISPPAREAMERAALEIERIEAQKKPA